MLTGYVALISNFFKRVLLKVELKIKGKAIVTVKHKENEKCKKRRNLMTRQKIKPRNIWQVIMKPCTVMTSEQPLF